MPSLRRWIETDSQRLRQAGKSALVERFEQFNRDYFDSNYGAVISAYSDLYQLAERHKEPLWGLLTQYYEATSSIYWRGNLARGLDIATQLIIDGKKFRTRVAVPMVYFQEILLYAWLETDGPGYAQQVLDVVTTTLSTLKQSDLIGRYQLLQAQCLVTLQDQQTAYDLYLSASSLLLDWPTPYHQGIKATALMAVDKLDEALPLFKSALLGYGELGLLFECSETRLRMAEIYLKRKQFEQAILLAEDVLNQANGIIHNQAHIGFGLHLMGQALVRQGLIAEGTGCFAIALETLDGLGWLRTEAEIGLALLKHRDKSGQPDNFTRADMLEDVRHRVYRLRSDDLHEQFLALSKHA